MHVCKKEILAFHQQDMEKILKNLGLWEDLISGKLRCNICNVEIDKNNLACIYPLDEEIKICCSNLNCLNRVRNLI